MVAHACDSRTLGGGGRRTTYVKIETSLANMAKHCPYQIIIIQKISWAWWHVLVVPATQEAKAGGWLEPRRWRLQRAKIAPLCSSLGKSETLSQKKKKIPIYWNNK